MVLHSKYIVKLESLICEPRACIMSCLINIWQVSSSKKEGITKLQKEGPGAFWFDKEGTEGFFRV